MKSGRIVALTAVSMFAIVTAWGAGPAFGVEKVQITLNPNKTGSGTAVFTDSQLKIRVKGLKPNSVYTVWYVNTDPKHEQTGVGQPPYAFTTDKKGAATYTAELKESPFGKWQMLVIVRHPNGDPKDMKNIEDAFWAHLKKDGGTTMNPCAANPCAPKKENPCAYKGGY